jgi:SAM-dependent MidA family methyltransferase
LRLENFTTQGQWLEAMGIMDELAGIRARDFAILDTDRGSDSGQIALFQWYNLRQQVSALTDPNGMGKFKVLILSA